MPSETAYNRHGVRLYTGDALEVLRTLPAESVQCVVTSPPFYQLRDYRIDGQIGLEPTLSAYLDRLIDVFREVRRVLHPSGIVWCEMGDSYAGAGYSNHANTGGAQREDGGKQKHTASFRPGNPDKNGGVSNRDGLGSIPGFKPKDLMLVPHRFAIAMQEDGWWVRQDNVWARPNPMPESVQGSHWSRHRVTIEEYERLSGLQYSWRGVDGNWSGDVRTLPPSAVPRSKTSLSTIREGKDNSASTRGAAGCEGDTPPLLSVGTRQSKQGEIRTDGEGQGYAGKSDCEIPRQRAWEAEGCGAAPNDESAAIADSTEARGDETLRQDRQGQGSQPSGAGSTPQGTGDRCAGNSRGLAADSGAAQAPLLLLQEAEPQINHRPRNPAQQRRQAREGKSRSGLPEVQLEEGGSDSSPLLVDCPGCSLCDATGGYVFKLSAGRTTRAHSYVFQFAKSERYYYDADAIREPSVSDHDNGNGYDRPERISRGGRGQRQEWTMTEWRNKRSVWTINTEAFPNAHFATFPRKLAELCIRAGSRERDIILDPFSGSGTVALMCRWLNRRCLGIELNPDYQRMAITRLTPTERAPLTALR